MKPRHRNSSGHLLDTAGPPTPTTPTTAVCYGSDGWDVHPPSGGYRNAYHAANAHEAALRGCQACPIRQPCHDTWAPQSGDYHPADMVAGGVVWVGGRRVAGIADLDRPAKAPRRPPAQMADVPPLRGNPHRWLTTLTDDNLRALHAAHTRGERGESINRGEREYQRRSSVRGRRRRDQQRAS